MLYCFDTRLPFDYSKLEMKIAKISGNGILYDSKSKTFTDFEGNEINITGKLIFPRTGVIQIYEMNDEIVNQGGIPVISNDQICMIENWPEYCFTKRKMIILKGKNLLDPNVISELENIYDKEIFIKTKVKNFNSVIPIELLRDTECALYKALSYHLDEDFIVSEKVDIVEDEYGKKEYRCFVVDNQIYNISRFTVDIFHKIDNNVLIKAEKVVKSLENKFSKYYVLDLFEYQKDDYSCVDVLEINPIHSSGLYLYNSVLQKSNDLLHTDLRNVSQEFIEKIDECSTDGNVINSGDSLYDIKGSFANDLRSICLTGDIGIVFSSCTNLSPTDFAKHTRAYELESMQPITDEDLFMSDEEFFEDCIFDGISEDVIAQVQKLLKPNKNN